VLIILPNYDGGGGGDGNVDVRMLLGHILVTL
jgi:hypothetical protein